MGSIWEGLGEVLGGIWRLLGPLGSFLEAFFSCWYLEWFSKVVLEASGLDFGSILQGLGWILGRFGEGFGQDFEGFSAFKFKRRKTSILDGIGALLDNSGRIMAAAACLFACCCILLLAFAC